MPIGLLAIVMVGCSGLGRAVQPSKEGDFGEERVEQVAIEYLESLYGKSVDALIIDVLRTDDGYFALVQFVQNNAGASDDRDFATVAISKDGEVVAVDYTNEGRRLKDPQAITTDARKNALPAETTERLIRQATAQGLLSPPQTGAASN
ncbi:MAG TPA: hypothetical protein VG826_22240 [Pirellulales bacterium]|nr:hypothetical protein [Pirellulales bacterium]